jgi:alkylhydroperoxidase family enzyme
MAWIRQIAQEQAGGLLRDIYAAAVKRAGRSWNILRIQSQNPPALRDGLALYATLLHGESPLSRVQRELLATVTSREVGCRY